MGREDAGARLDRDTGPMTTNPFSLEGRTALVTGANRGLGRAFATALASAGADVVVVGRDDDRNQQAATEIAQLTGQRVSVGTGDISDADRRTPHRGGRARGPREARHPGQQRRRVLPSSGPGGPRRGVRPGLRRQRDGAVADVEGGRAEHDRGRWRLDRQRGVDLRDDREPSAVAAGVQRLEGCGASADEVTGGRVGSPPDQGERDRAGLREDRDGARRRAAVPSSLDRGRSDAALRDPRRRSRPAWSTSPATPPPSPRARCWSPTVATRCTEAQGASSPGSAGTSTACCRRTESGTICSTASLVEASTTGAANPASWARAQLAAVTHHRSPGTSPGKP